MAPSPNILIIQTDQQRFDSLGVNGGPWAVTPCLDRLAAEGVNFSNFFVQSPVCMPSRMSLLTGLYPGNIGIGGNGTALPESVPTLPAMLKEAGYASAVVGKLHLAPFCSRDWSTPEPHYSFDRALVSDQPGSFPDAYFRWVKGRFPEHLQSTLIPPPPPAPDVLGAMGYRYSPDGPQEPRQAHLMHRPYVNPAPDEATHLSFVVEETARFIQESAGAAWLAVAGFVAPHNPVNPTRRFAELINPQSVSLPLLGSDERWSEALAGLTESDWRRVRAFYAGFVAEMDAAVGRLLHALDRTGQSDNTVVVFLSDHGEYLGDHGRTAKGAPGHDCIVRVPFIMRCPSRIPRGVSDALVEGVDLAPTLLEMAGLAVPSALKGRSLMPILRGSSSVLARRSLGEGGRDSVLMQFWSQGREWGMVRTRDWKYARCNTCETYLYQVAKDPHELTNLAGRPEHRDIERQMADRLSERLAEAQGPRLIEHKGF